MEKAEKNKKIYIILSYTGTVPSRIIKFFTKGEYSHVSISLDKNLKKMYSFARLHPYNPFVGGFVHEDKDTGTFKRFKKTRVSVYSFDVSAKQYRKIWWRVHKMVKEQKIYKFNYIGLCGVKLKFKFSRKNYFYCAEFVKYLFDEANIDLDLPELVAPMDFKGKKCFHLEYKGLLQKYVPKLD